MLRALGVEGSRATMSLIWIAFHREGVLCRQGSQKTENSGTEITEDLTEARKAINVLRANPISWFTISKVLSAISVLKSLLAVVVHGRLIRAHDRQR